MGNWIRYSPSRIRIAARHHRPAAGSRQQAARGSVAFRLMSKWKNQRRRRTRQSRLWFIISSGLWRRTQLLAVIICIIWYYLDIELQDCNASVVHFCYLDNRSAFGVMAHNTSDSRLWYFYNETRIGDRILQHEWLESVQGLVEKP